MNNVHLESRKTRPNEYPFYQFKCTVKISKSCRAEPLNTNVDEIKKSILIFATSVKLNCYFQFGNFEMMTITKNHQVIKSNIAAVLLPWLN